MPRMDETCLALALSQKHNKPPNPARLVFLFFSSLPLLQTFWQGSELKVQVACTLADLMKASNVGVSSHGTLPP